MIWGARTVVVCAGPLLAPAWTTPGSTACTWVFQRSVACTSASSRPASPATAARGLVRRSSVECSAPTIPSHATGARAAASRGLSRRAWRSGLTRAVSSTASSSSARASTSVPSCTSSIPAAGASSSQRSREARARSNTGPSGWEPKKRWPKLRTAGADGRRVTLEDHHAEAAPPRLQRVGQPDHPGADDTDVGVQFIGVRHLVSTSLPIRQPDVRVSRRSNICVTGSAAKLV